MAKALSALGSSIKLRISDLPPDNPSKPLHRIRTRQWLAERWDAKTYGAKQAAVTVNIGNLRLDALRQLEVVEDLSTGETPSF